MVVTAISTSCFLLILLVSFLIHTFCSFEVRIYQTGPGLLFFLFYLFLFLPPFFFNLHTAAMITTEKDS